jgi:hypothetical protein
LQSPTTGSLEAMIREADRDEQIAAARMLPKIPVVQLPDAPLPTPVKPAATEASNTQPASSATVAAAPVTPKVTNTTTAPAEELPSFIPAPKSLVSERAASEVATVNASTAGNQNAVLTSLPAPVDTSLNVKSGTNRVAQISFLPTDDVLRIGEKRRYAIQMSSDVSLSLALFAIRFDPKVVKVTTISAGTLLAHDAAAALTQSIDPTGVCLISISGLNGKNPIKGTGALFFLDVEAVGIGNAALVFDQESLHLVATDAKDVTTKIAQGSATVKQ